MSPRHATAVAVLLVVLALPAGSVAGVAGGATQQEQCTFPVTETDATGTEVTVQEEPERVVVLQASAAQVMWEIGAEEKVVGMPVKPYTEYLEGSEERTDVVTAEGQVERETVVGLEPDLVLAPNVVPNDTVDQLREDGLTVYKTDFEESLEDIYAKTEFFGRMVGHCDEAEQRVSEMRSQVETIRETVADEERPRVLYTFYGFTAGNGTFVHEILETAGGDNIAANAGIEGYDEMSEEEVADRDPEWVVVPDDASLPEGEPWESTTAYQENQTLTVDANYMNQPAPRVVIPMMELAEAFHPEAFAEATETEAGTPTATQPATPGGTDNDLPGFGFPAAVVALAALAAALLARR